jgi:hypothetical protein
MAPASEIIQLLTRLGPSLSSDIGKELQKLGFSDVAARKVIQRARAPIKRLSDIRFPHNRRFLYLDSQFRSEKFLKSLLAAFDSTGSIYGVALRALEGYGGVIPIAHFPRISGLPQGLKGQLSPDQVLNNLLKVGLLERVHIFDIGECVKLGSSAPFAHAPYMRVRARLIAEDILLLGLQNWVKKNGLASFDKVKVRIPESTPDFAHVRWDLTAPSYLLPLSERNGAGATPGFVTADVSLADRLDEANIGYLLRKCVSISSRGKNRPFLPMLIASGFTRDALRAGRKAGLILTTPENFFGSEIAEALQNLIEVLGNAAAKAETQPEIIGELFSRLGKIEGAAGNLRGPLFELLVAHCVRECEGTSVDIGVIAVTSKGEKADIDVLSVKRRQKICAYECKGIAPTKEVTEEEIKKWITGTIPRVYEWFQNQESYRGIEVSFEFWTSGVFSPEALALLNERKAHTQRYEINWRDGAEVYAYAKKIRSRRIEDLLNEHFLKHPLSETAKFGSKPMREKLFVGIQQ